jgi:hypothetical protein
LTGGDGPAGLALALGSFIPKTPHNLYWDFVVPASGGIAVYAASVVASPPLFRLLGGIHAPIVLCLRKLSLAMDAVRKAQQDGAVPIVYRVRAARAVSDVAEWWAYLKRALRIGEPEVDATAARRMDRTRNALLRASARLLTRTPESEKDAMDVLRTLTWALVRDDWSLAPAEEDMPVPKPKRAKAKLGEVASRLLVGAASVALYYILGTNLTGKLGAAAGTVEIGVWVWAVIGILTLLDPGALERAAKIEDLLTQ